MTLWNEWQKESGLLNKEKLEHEYSYPDDYVKWLEDKIIYLTKWIKIDHHPRRLDEYLVYGYDYGNKLVRAMEWYDPFRDIWDRRKVIYPIAWVTLPRIPSTK